MSTFRNSVMSVRESTYPHSQGASDNASHRLYERFAEERFYERSHKRQLGCRTEKTDQQDDGPGEPAELFLCLLPVVDRVVVHHRASGCIRVLGRERIRDTAMGVDAEAVTGERELKRMPEALIRSHDKYDL
jgi:hypothetical protein